MDKKAVKVTMSEELYNWYLERSKATGLSVPALIVMASDKYKRENEDLSK